MLLAQSTWYEVEAYLAHTDAIIIPCGSIEQHGPMGVIGTDALCAETIANGMGARIDALIAPVIAYTPAPFNLHFAGSISIKHDTFVAMLKDVVESLQIQGFRKFYFLNAHGANIAPIKSIKDDFGGNCQITIRSWWDYAPVNEMRQSLYGRWEGMHATPSEIAITQVDGRVIDAKLAKMPPTALSPDFIKTHSGDRHGPPDQHKQQFPDGRVGSHSAMATRDHGIALRDLAIACACEDYLEFARAD